MKTMHPKTTYRYEEQPTKGDKKMSNSSSKGTALITGASRGIGAVYAHRLAKRGFDLILVARSVEPLNALAASLSSASGRHITSIVADLNNETDLAKVETKLKDDPSITLLVNNAGFASVAPLLDADIQKMEEMIALNIIALTRLTYAAAPAFVKRGTGTIINIGSAAGHLGRSDERRVRGVQSIPLIGHEAVSRKVPGGAQPRAGRPKALECHSPGGGPLYFPQARRHFTQLELFCNNRSLCELTWPLRRRVCCTAAKL